MLACGVIAVAVVEAVVVVAVAIVIAVAGSSKKSGSCSSSSRSSSGALQFIFSVSCVEGRRSSVVGGPVLGCTFLYRIGKTIGWTRKLIDCRLLVTGCTFESGSPGRSSADPCTGSLSCCV